MIILITWPLRRGFVTKINIFKTFYNLRWVCYNLRQLFKFYNLRQPVFTFYDSFGTDCFLHFTTGLLQFTTVITIYDKFITIYDSFYNLRQFLQFTTAHRNAAHIRACPYTRNSPFFDFIFRFWSCIRAALIFCPGYKAIFSTWIECSISKRGL